MPHPLWSFRSLLLLLSLALTACQGGVGTRDGQVAGAPAGNAEGYNGGDADELKLRLAKRSAFLRLSDVSKNLLPSRLCSYQACSASGSPWCEALFGLSSEQEQACRSFVVDSLPALLGQNLVPVVLREGDLSVEGRAVDASTELGSSGSILFSRNSVRRLSTEQIQVVLFHELGHKVAWNGINVADAGALGGYASGRELLDTAAAALMVYSQTTGIQGCFDVAGTGYYGNALGHYCSLANWQDWLSAGGPSDPAQIPHYAFIPPSMIYDGVCNVP